MTKWSVQLFPPKLPPNLTAKLRGFANWRIDKLTINKEGVDPPT